MFKVDEKVVCIHTFPVREDSIAGVKHPIKGEMYTIRQIMSDGYLIFHEIINPILIYKNGPGEATFEAGGFRPLDYSFVEEVMEQIKEEPCLV